MQLYPKTELFGLPLPSADPMFIALVSIHILLSLLAVVLGAIAMLREKGSAGHATFGKLYYWSILLAFVTVVGLVTMRWPHNNHLLAIGLITTILVYVGRRYITMKGSRWPKYHAICMSGSYVLLLTGFYVDNGEHLPFWNQFPQWFFLVFPSTIGIPFIWRVIKMHPMTRS